MNKRFQNEKEMAKDKGVFDFLNRLFDRMKMHKVENSVDITEKSRVEKAYT